MSFDTAMECSCPDCKDESSAILGNSHVLAFSGCGLMVSRISNSSVSMDFPAQALTLVTSYLTAVACY